MARSDLPEDVDLTLKMDFNSKSERIKSIRLPKDVKDESYKRYNEYKREHQTTSYASLDSSFTSSFTDLQRTSTTSYSFSPSLFDSLINGSIIKVEERVCWRKLYKDPDIYGHCRTPEECEDHIRNLNFPLGSKLDRLKCRSEVEKLKKDFGSGYFCDCCGKKLNLRNCLEYDHSLCITCAARLYNDLKSMKL